MLISVSGIDGSGKTTLIKKLAERLGAFVPKHVSTFVEYPSDLADWYTKGDINDVVALDVKAFALRNNDAAARGNALLDRGFLNITNSASARYQERLGISREDSLKRVMHIADEVGLQKVEEISVLLDFPSDEWSVVLDIIRERGESVTEDYARYLKILFHDLKHDKATFDIVLDATKSIDENVEELLRRLPLELSS